MDLEPARLQVERVVVAVVDDDDHDHDHDAVGVVCALLLGGYAATSREKSLAITKKDCSAGRIERSRRR